MASTELDDDTDEVAAYDNSSSIAPTGMLSWPAAIYGTEAPEERTERGDTVGEENYREELSGESERRIADTGDGTWLDEGLISLLILAGAALFLFPEPATSGLGIFLLALGIAGWLVDMAMTGD